MKFDNHLRYAVQITDDYSGEIPLHSWLKSFFRANPQMGSNDRKQVSSLVYSYYRMGHALREVSKEERMMTGLFLVSKSKNALLNHHKPEWAEFIDGSLDQKLECCRQSGINVELSEIFPWRNMLSPDIEYLNLCKSFLVQPDLFIRIRPGFEEQVKRKLSRQEIAFEQLSGHALRLSNTTPVDRILELNSEAVIQDYSSQRTSDFFSLPELTNLKKTRAWDCCAASGGKSILLHDRFPGISITASDIRESILINLKKRFIEAGIKNYQSFVADLTKPPNQFSALQIPFDLILMDAPCTGSGTWSRNPEELYFFNDMHIARFRQLQEKIFRNVITKIKSHGVFIYITCSVFQRENEGMVEFIRQNSSLQLIRSALIRGDKDKADTLFVASFKA
jgi:16S rRNA (cytosine967-C5)-methyltransferase